MNLLARRSSIRLSLTLAMIVFAFGALIPAAHAQEDPSVSIVSPEEGEAVTSTDITLEVEHSGFDESCELVGTPDQDGEGHLHVMVDGASMANLINFYCETDTITIPGTALEPGEHTIIVTISSNSHMDLMDTANEVVIDYQPDEPVAAPEPEEFDDPPVVEITNLENGATLGSVVTLELQSENFNASAALEGKPNLRGYGHYHVFMDMPMQDGMPDMENMSMEGMLAMPGADTVELDLSAWPEGEHMLTVMPANNDHTPIMPSEMAMLSFTLDHGDADEEASADESVDEEADADESTSESESDEPELPATGAGGAATSGDSGFSLVHAMIAAAAILVVALGFVARMVRVRAS